MKRTALAMDDLERLRGPIKGILRYLDWVSLVRRRRSVRHTALVIVRRVSHIVEELRSDWPGTSRGSRLARWRALA